MISKEKGLELKGLAILIVMTGHLVTINKISINYDFRYFAAFSVSIFLILSGYGLSKSFDSNKLNGFFKKRLKNVIWPYFLATLMVSLWLGVLINDPIKAIRSATLTGPNNQVDGTMWFIYFIVLWYIIFYVTYSSIKNTFFRILTILAISFFINEFDIPYIDDGLLFQFKLHSYSFVIGIIIANLSDYLNYRARCVLLFLSLIAFSFSLYYTITDFSMFSYSSASVFFGLSLLFIFSILKIKLLFLLFFGGISYEMYLFEGVLMGLNYNDIQFINVIVFIFITTSISITFKKIHSVI